MKKLLFIVCVLLTNFAISFAQTLPLPQPILKNGWTRVNIINVGFFDIPASMEVQKGKYKESMDKIRKTKGYDVSQLTVQQKGLNQHERKGFEKYARVMVETSYGNIDEYEKLNFEINKIEKDEISKLNSTYKQQTINSFVGTENKLIDWYPLKIEIINGMSCVHIIYKRQLNDKPFVLVHTYIFYNSDRIHTLTLSYRFSEFEFWKADFATILKSFRITNIK